MLSKDSGGEGTVGSLVRQRGIQLWSTMLWSIAGMGRGNAPVRGAETGETVPSSLVGEVARGVVEPEVLELLGLDIVAVLMRIDVFLGQC
jgi:hypothetical protein